MTAPVSWPCLRCALCCVFCFFSQVSPSSFLHSSLPACRGPHLILLIIQARRYKVLLVPVGRRSCAVQEPKWLSRRHVSLLTSCLLFSFSLNNYILFLFLLFWFSFTMLLPLPPGITGMWHDMMKKTVLYSKLMQNRKFLDFRFWILLCVTDGTPQDFWTVQVLSTLMCSDQCTCLYLLYLVRVFG